MAATGQSVLAWERGKYRGPAMVAQAWCTLRGEGCYSRWNFNLEVTRRKLLGGLYDYECWELLECQTRTCASLNGRIICKPLSHHEMDSEKRRSGGIESPRYPYLYEYVLQTYDGVQYFGAIFVGGGWAGRPPFFWRCALVPFRGLGLAWCSLGDRDRGRQWFLRGRNGKVRKDRVREIPTRSPQPTQGRL